MMKLIELRLFMPLEHASVSLGMKRKGKAG
jgi:hypothetical protein